MILERFFLRKVSPLLCLLLISQFANAQYELITPVRIGDQTDYAGLSDVLSEAAVYEFDLPMLSDLVQDDAFNHALEFDLEGLGEFRFSLVQNPIYSTQMRIRAQTPEGIIEMPSPDKIKTFKGYSPKGDRKVRLTIDHNFINGFIETHDDVLYIDLLSNYVDGVPGNYVIMYYASATLEEGPFECDPRFIQDISDPDGADDNQQSRAPGDCYEVEVAFANDWLMFDDHGSVTAVENHNIAVMNNAQANYDDEFEEELHFEIVEIFVSTCETCDPWTSSTSAGALLDDFADWAGNGFDETHDLANLWTDRNFNGPTIGLAWVSAVCFQNFKYSTTQDFTTNANLLRVLLAHEFGHLFGALHDASGSPTIMAPNVSNVNSWSTASVNDIDDYVDDINCLGPCPTSLPPEAGFSSDEVEGCPPLEVHFFDESSGVVTGWQWTFPGGTPGFSTQQNPIVEYNTPGTYDVTLSVSNGAGSNEITLQDYITVLPDPEAEFTYSPDELIVSFFDMSENADTYTWDFGDGESSNEQSPVHLYEQDGVYTVILTVTNACGVDTYVLEIEVISVPIAGFDYEPGFGCQPLTVQFFNESTDNVEEFFWSFDGGEPSTSTSENPIVIYEEAGTYSVSLVVTNSAGDDVIILDDIITVEPLPVAGFNYSVDGLEAQFVSTASFNTSTQWFFGDGNGSGSENPAHTYETGGIYNVMQIVDNDCGTDTMIQTLNVDGPPNAGMSVSGGEGCAPFTVTFTSTSSGDVDSYLWSFPGGSPNSSTQAMPIVTYNNPGSYDAQLIVSNTSGSDTIFINDIVVVNPPVVSDFNFQVDGPIVDFFNQSSGETDILWIINGEEYTNQNPTVAFEQDGDYEVVLIANGPCGSDTSVQTIHIATPPLAGFSVSGSTTGCEPFTVQFFNTSSSNAESFNWSFPGGTPSTSNLENPIVTYEQAGVYSVSLIVTSEAGSDEEVLDDIIVVNPLPEAGFQTVQTGTVVEFDNLSVEADSYKWLFGDGGMSTKVNPTHDYGDFGEYEIMLIATNDCGADTFILQLQLAELPVPVFGSEVRAGCSPLEVQFTDMSQNGAESWEWEFDGGVPAMSTDQNPLVVYNSPGIYTVRLTVFNNAGSQTLVRFDYILVEEEPVAEFKAEVSGDGATFDNTSLNATSYFWDFGDGNTDTSSNPMHVYLGPGIYPVTLYASNSCATDTFELDVQILSTFTYIPNDEGELGIWPNPNAGQFSITSTPGEMVDLQIVDVTGRTVWIANRSDLATLETINVRLQVGGGLYYLVAEGQDGRRAIPVIIQD